MNEWTVASIIAALVAVAFAPSFLRSKCPGCKKRRLNTVVPDEVTLTKLQEVDDRKYLTFYSCDACKRKYLRQRTGPFEDASAPELQMVFADKAMSDAPNDQASSSV